MNNIQSHRLFLFGSLPDEPLSEELEMAEKEAQLFEKINQISPDQNLTEQVTDLLGQIASIENHRRTMHSDYYGLEPVYIQALYTHIRQHAYLNREIASLFLSLKNRLYENLHQIVRICDDVSDTSCSLQNKSRPANQFFNNLCSLIIFCNDGKRSLESHTNCLPSLRECEKPLINSSWISMGSPKKEIPWSKAERTVQSLYLFNNILSFEKFCYEDLLKNGFCSYSYSPTKQKKFLDSKIEYAQDCFIGKLYSRLLSEARCTQLGIIQYTNAWGFYIPELKQEISNYKHMKVQEPRAFEPALIEFTQHFEQYWPYLSQICSAFSQTNDTNENLIAKKRQDTLTLKGLMERPMWAALVEALDPLYALCKEKLSAQDSSSISFRPKP